MRIKLLGGAREIVFGERLAVFHERRGQLLSQISPMPSFDHLAVDLYASLIGVVESEFGSMRFEPIIISVRIRRIERISFSSFRDDLDIHGQSCLMFAGSRFRASQERASLADHEILE